MLLAIGKGSRAASKGFASKGSEAASMGLRVVGKGSKDAMQGSRVAYMIVNSTDVLVGTQTSQGC